MVLTANAQIIVIVLEACRHVQSHPMVPTSEVGSAIVNGKDAYLIVSAVWQII